ncbi:MAG TPA: BrnT family toxin [Bradyrhizobium sp.]|nr:BrnT family toxin [Bradyrhizobium sp.]
MDFEDAAEVFRGDTLDFPDNRRDYGELRMLTIGHLRGRMVIVIWTPRGNARHVISMRKANAREKARFGKRFEKN